MIKIIEADLLDRSQQNDLIATLNGYALDPMGGGKALSEYTMLNLAFQLHKRKNTTVFLAYVDDVAAGLLICMEGFSTFACRPLLNIHDLAVMPVYRGLGLSKQLLRAAEQKAKLLGCCKLTIEVLQGNAVARAVYAGFGFEGFELDPLMGKALFLEKPL